MWHWLGEGLHDTNKKKKIEFKVGEKKSWCIESLKRIL